MVKVMQTVLLIEDNRYDAQLISTLFKRLPECRVLYAADAETGLTLAMSESPDLILLDLGLPDMDGQTVASILKDMPASAHIPLIAVTAWPPATARDMAEAYGCDGYISKPFNANAFLAEIKRFLKQDNTASAETLL
ncbi:MAG TPA: response regulator [Anaerolineae bacterium]|nr:response regulator [Anaerolineae bacterium]